MYLGFPSLAHHVEQSNISGFSVIFKWQLSGFLPLWKSVIVSNVIYQFSITPPFAIHKLMEVYFEVLILRRADLDRF